MVDTEKTIRALSSAALFRGLNHRQLERFAQRFVERTYDEDEVIVGQGKGGEGLFIIVLGAAKAVREMPNGGSIQVNDFGSGDYFGELALLDDGPRTASVITTEPTTCVVLTRWDFLGMLKKDAETAVAILQELAKRFRAALNAM